MVGKKVSDSDNVRVVVRCRPIMKSDPKDCKIIVQVDERVGSISVKNPAEPHEEPRAFTFDYTFSQTSKQADVYNLVAKPIVDAVIEGYNGTVFAYGQTGTGKTFTMVGDWSKPELKGIIPNSFAYIFDHISKATGNQQFLVRVSYLEIYNEEVRDLLGKNPKERLEVKERPDVGVYVKDLSSVVCHGPADMERVMSKGNENRSVGSTNMNEQSSRSHAIFSIAIERSDTGPDNAQRLRLGKLHLVDLAGSERQAKTGATGDRLKEATKINLSLTTLGNVISALVDGKSSHIPYRNSKLTRLLQDSLGGNAKTVMIANVGPADYNFDETVNTLRYANRAKNIKNNAKINEDPKDALLRQMQEEIEKLKQQLGGDGDYDDGEGDDESGEEDEDGVTVGGGKSRKKRSKGGLSQAKMVEIQAKIDADRRKLEQQKDMEEEERNRIANQLEEREAEVRKAKEEQERLQQQLSNIEKKIIVGGENLLEKAEIQAKLLEESGVEIQRRIETQEELKKRVQSKQAERLDLEEKYSSLQDEASGKTKKLEKLKKRFSEAKSELTDIQGEQQREVEGLLDNIRQLSRELKLQNMIINNFIPSQYQEVIKQNVTWNEELGEWQLRCVAYAGNNARKLAHENDAKADRIEFDTTKAYHTYASVAPERSLRPKTGARAKGADRPKTSGRPKTSSRPRTARKT